MLAPPFPSCLETELTNAVQGALVAESTCRTRIDAAVVTPQEMIDADFKLPPDSVMEPTLRLWTNSRCVVASRGQALKAGFALASSVSATSGWPVATRRSGGTAVVHRPGILNVSLRQLVAPGFNGWMTAGYAELLSLMSRAMSRMGVLCDEGPVAGAYCDGRFNLRSAGRKLAGTAAYAGAVPPAGYAPGTRVSVFHASITLDGPVREDLEAVGRFEKNVGLPGSYDPAAHVSLSELVATQRHRGSVESTLMNRRRWL